MWRRKTDDRRGIGKEKDIERVEERARRDDVRRGEKRGRGQQSQMD